MSMRPPVTSAPASKRLLMLRICIVLSFVHAVVLTSGAYLVWMMRRFTSQVSFAPFAEPFEFWLLVLWPIWWLVVLALYRGNWRLAGRALKTATIVWLFTAIPALIFLGYLGLYFLSYRW